jgi:hypothetical protein
VRRPQPADETNKVRRKRAAVGEERVPSEREGMQGVMRG